MRPSPRSVVIGALIGLAATVGIAAPAVADGTTTTVAFIETEAATVPFGSPWLFTIAVTGEHHSSEHGYSVAEIGPESGTVDVYVDGIAGAYATGLPLQATGVVYFAQPADQPLLAAGTHTLRAIFNPLAGSNLETSQTQTPATITIEPLTVVATLAATMDAAAGEHPVLTGSLSGSSVDTWGGAPAGVWTFAVTDPDGETVFQREAPQPGLSSTPVVVEVDVELARDTEYVVAGTFTPDSTLAQGLTVTQASDAAFRSAAASVGEFLVTPVAVEWWALALSASALLLLGGALAWVIVRRRRLRRPTTSSAPADGLANDDDDSASVSPAAATEPAESGHDTVLTAP